MKRKTGAETHVSEKTHCVFQKNQKETAKGGCTITPLWW